MHPNSPLSLMLSTALAGLALAGLAAPARAQSPTECPALPQEATDLQWSVLRTDTALLCRAIRRDSGQEAFALTLSRKSPFRPTSDLREEEGRIHGEKVWWYRTEIAGRPNELVRETLVKVDRDQVAHVFIRTGDKDTLGRYQTIVQGLEFDPGTLATR